jgi:hypothetical protein
MDRAIEQRQHIGTRAMRNLICRAAEMSKNRMAI